MITIISEPSQLQPSSNEIMVVLDSTLKTKDNFLFIVDIKVNGADNSRLRVPVNPDGYGIVDLHKHIQENLSSPFSPTASGFNLTLSSFATYSITLQEEFRDYWRFDDNFYNSGYVGFRSSTQSYFEIGDQVYIQQDEPFTNNSYQGISEVTSSGYSASLAGGSWFIITDKSFGSSTSAEPGTASLANFELTQVTSTASFTGRKTAFNGVIDWIEFPNWGTDYIVGNSSRQMMTNIPDNYKLRLDSRMNLKAYTPIDNGIGSLYFETSNGTYEIINSFTQSATNDNHLILEIGAGPYNILNSTYSVLSGSAPALDTTTSTMSMYLKNTSGTQVTKTYNFIIDHSCTRYEVFQLVFLDRLGSYVPFNFIRSNQHKYDISRATYKKNYGNYDGSSWTYNTSSRGKSVIHSNVTEKYSCNSDWVDDSTAEYLRELFTSPEVYWISESGVVTPIIITNTKYEMKQTIRDQIINYQIEFELAYKNNSI